MRLRPIMLPRGMKTGGGLSESTAGAASFSFFFSAALELTLANGEENAQLGLRGAPPRCVSRGDPECTCSSFAAASSSTHALFAPSADVVPAVIRAAREERQGVELLDGCQEEFDGWLQRCSLLRLASAGKVSPCLQEKRLMMPAVTTTKASGSAESQMRLTLRRGRSRCPL